MQRAKAKYHHGDLRTALIDAAVKTIRKRGSADFTIRDLAATLRVTHAAAYRHFADKTAILAAVAERGFRLLGGEIEKVDARAATQPMQCLTEKGVAYVLFAARNPGYFRAMFHSNLRDKREYPELATAAHAAFNSLTRTVKACQKSGMWTGQSTELITFKAWAVVHGLAFLVVDGQLPGFENVQMNKAQASRLTSRIAKVLTAGM